MTTQETEALDALMQTEWEAHGCAVYSEEVEAPLFTTFVPDAAGEVFPTDLDSELAKRLAAFPDLLAALREALATLEAIKAEAGKRQAIVMRSAGRCSLYAFTLAPCAKARAALAMAGAAGRWP